MTSKLKIPNYAEIIMHIKISTAINIYLISKKHLLRIPII